MDMVPSHGVTTTDSSRGTRLSTSLLYQRFGVVGYHYVRQTFAAGATFFRIEQPRERLRCSACGSAAVWGQGGVRAARFVQLAHRRNAANGYLEELKVPRVYCTMRLRRDPPGRNQLRRTQEALHPFVRTFYALELSQRMTVIQDVADHLLVSWDTIKEIQATHLQRKFGKPKLHKLKQIAIDEICIGKGHRYLTVVLNLLSGAVVFVGDGKAGML